MDFPNPHMATFVHPSGRVTTLDFHINVTLQNDKNYIFTSNLTPEELDVRSKAKYFVLLERVSISRT